MPEHKDILTHLEHEHRTVEQLFAKLEKSDPGQARDALVKELSDALGLHMAVEERFIYPLVSQNLGREERVEATNEHELARDGLTTLQQMRDQPGFGAAVEMLKAGISHHVEEEESSLFPELREKAGSAVDALDPDELEQQVRAGAAPPEEPAASDAAASEPASSKSHVDVDLTKDELYKQAQEADIAGRSSMTKAQLIDALNDA